MQKQTFYEHFSFAMQSVIIISPPKGWFQGTVTTLGTIKAISSVVETYGYNITLAEVVGSAPAGILSAGFASEGATIGLGCLAAAFVGISVGSLAYAIGQYSSERLWTYTEPKECMKPQNIIRTSRKHSIQISPAFQNFIYHDFQRCVASHAPMQCAAAH